MSKKRTTTESKKNDGMLPKMELLIIFVFFMSFIVWAMSKCSSTQAQYEQKAGNDTTATVPSKETAKATADKTKDLPTEEVTARAKSTVKAPPEKVTVLYVVLDGLKLRKGPHLDSAIVRTLKINNEVYFLNQTTDFKQEINLGDRLAVEPWVKVRAYTGHEGWVYGAGVHYFKPKTITDTIAN